MPLLALDLSSSKHTSCFMSRSVVYVQLQVQVFSLSYFSLHYAQVAYSVITVIHCIPCLYNEMV